MSSKMKAIVMDDFGSPDVLRLGVVERPVPGPGQVLVQIAATSVNRPDIVQREGNYPPPSGESEILGLEIAGTVVELGTRTEDWNVGDRVLALISGGGYAEFATAYAGHLLRIPDETSFVEAACVCETYITAYLNLFRIANLGNRDIVLLHGGGGGVNTAAIQLCRVLTPSATILVTASPGKVDRVRKLGVKFVIDYQNKHFPEEVENITSGRGANVILDHIGAAYLTANMKSLAVEGTLVVIGVTRGISSELNLAAMMVKRQRIIGSVLRPRSVPEKTQIISDFARVVMPLVENRQIVPLIHHVFPLQEAASAHRMMEASSHFGKIVLSTA